jgi:D-amino-acid oxidase
MTDYFDDQADDSNLWYKALMPGYGVIPLSQLPPGVTFGAEYISIAMNLLRLLPWLKEKLLGKGVKSIQAEIKNIGEARNITCSQVIVNASGIGAKTLAGDDNVLTIRGQTMFVNSDSAN